MEVNNHYPVVFMHFGDREYLKPVFEVAIKKGNKVVLIGDNSNKHYTNLGLLHYSFSELLTGDIVDEFNKHFKFIHGKEFTGSEYWVRFNFYKMFVLYSFMSKHNIKHCWLFDSDVIICENLSLYASQFKHLDYTHQPLMPMPQGWIGGKDILLQFFKYCIVKFQDNEFIEDSKKDFEQTPIYGLTYMRFWEAFVEEENKVNRSPFTTIRNDQVWVPHIFNDTGLTFYEIFISHMPLSEIFFDKGKKVLVRKREDQKLYEPIILNLSWLPQYLVNRISNHIMGRDKFSFFIERIINKNKLPLKMHLAKSRLNQIISRVK